MSNGSAGAKAICALRLRIILTRTKEKKEAREPLPTERVLSKSLPFPDVVTCPWVVVTISDQIGGWVYVMLDTLPELASKDSHLRKVVLWAAKTRRSGSSPDGGVELVAYR